MRKYVGLQEVNAGASAEPINISPVVPVFIYPFARNVLLSVNMFFTRGTLDHSVGNMKVRPTNMTSAPEK